MKRVALYARVSKGDDQNPETQLLELRRWAQAQPGIEAEEFVERLSSRDRRPKKEEVLRRLRVGELDTVAVVRLDRWGRGMAELVLELDELTNRGIAFVSLREGLRFDDATGRLLAHVLAAFANFERDLIQERTNAGLKRARSEGKIGGRHPVGCGCGATPEGGKPHRGPVIAIRDRKGHLTAWKWPDGHELRVGRPKSNPPRTSGGIGPSETVRAE